MGLLVLPFSLTVALRKAYFEYEKSATQFVPYWSLRLNQAQRLVNAVLIRPSIFQLQDKEQKDDNLFDRTVSH